MACGGEDGKTPLDSKGRKASRTVADVWRSYEAASAQALEHGYGVGWVIQPGYIVLDLDKAFDEEGEIKDQFKGLSRVGTYIERSVSGTGLHVFLRSDVRPEGQNEKAHNPDGSAIEVLAPGWYVRVTGDKLEGKPETIKSGDEIVEKALRAIRQRKGEPQVNPQGGRFLP
jgi:putative DNA primase/helicase